MSSCMLAIRMMPAGLGGSHNSSEIEYAMLQTVLMLLMQRLPLIGLF